MSFCPKVEISQKLGKYGKWSIHERGTPKWDTRGSFIKMGHLVGYLVSQPLCAKMFPKMLRTPPQGQGARATNEIVTETAKRRI